MNNNQADDPKENEFSSEEEDIDEAVWGYIEGEQRSDQDPFDTSQSSNGMNQILQDPDLDDPPPYYPSSENDLMTQISGPETYTHISEHLFLTDSNNDIYQMLHEPTNLDNPPPYYPNSEDDLMTQESDSVIYSPISEPEIPTPKSAPEVSTIISEPQISNPEVIGPKNNCFSQQSPINPIPFAYIYPVPVVPFPQNFVYNVQPFNPINQMFQGNNLSSGLGIDAWPNSANEIVSPALKQFIGFLQYKIKGDRNVRFKKELLHSLYEIFQKKFKLEPLHRKDKRNKLRVFKKLFQIKDDVIYLINKYPKFYLDPIFLPH